MTKNNLPEEFCITTNRKGEEIIEKLEKLGYKNTYTLLGSAVISYYGIKGNTIFCSVNSWKKPISYDEFISLIEEEWVTFNNPNGTYIKLIHNKKYKVISPLNNISSCLQVEDEGVVRSVNKHWFKEYQEEKEIIGYKTPFNMFNGDVKKGHVFRKVPGDNSYYPENHSTLYKNLPKEIVETWEPIYEEKKESILYIGVPLQKITISKNKISCDGRIIDYSTLLYLGSNFNPTIDMLGNWFVSIPKIKIGCTEITKDELTKVINEYTKINN